MSSLSAAETAFVLIGIILMLGSLLVWALFELESWRHNMRPAASLQRNARDRRI